MADHDHGARIARDDGLPATACLRDRDSWSARRAAAGRARRTAPRRAPPACASRRRIPRTARCCSACEKPRPARIAAARAGAECAPMSASRVWISAMRCGSCAVSASASSAVRSRVGREHDVDQAFRAVRRLLREPADARARRQLIAPLLGRDLAGDRAEQRGLAGAVAADQPDARAGRHARRGVVEQEAAADPVGEVVEGKHGTSLAAAVPSATSCGAAARLTWKDDLKVQIVARQPWIELLPAEGRMNMRGSPVVV